MKMRRNMKNCFGKCDRCVWMYNRGCSEWSQKIPQTAQHRMDKDVVANNEQETKNELVQ